MPKRGTNSASKAPDDSFFDFEGIDKDKFSDSVRSLRSELSQVKLAIVELDSDFFVRNNLPFMNLPTTAKKLRREITARREDLEAIKIRIQRNNEIKNGISIDSSPHQRASTGGPAWFLYNEVIEAARAATARCNELANENEHLKRQADRHKTSSKAAPRLEFPKFDDSPTGKIMPRSEAIARWPSWKSDVVALINDIDTDSSTKRAYLKSFGGEIIKRIDENGTDVMDNAEKLDKPFEALIAKIDLALKKDTALIYHNQCQFAKMEQLEDENVDEFLARLQKTVNTCDYDQEEKSKALRKQFTIGCKHKLEIMRTLADPTWSGKPFDQLVTLVTIYERTLTGQQKPTPARSTVPIFDLNYQRNDNRRIARTTDHEQTITNLHL